MLDRSVSLVIVNAMFSVALVLWVSLLSEPAQAGVTRQLQELNQEQHFHAAYALGIEQLAEEAGQPRFDMLFGVSALETGHYEQALFAFERVLMFDPHAAVARLELARTHFMLGNPLAARRHFNRVLAQDDLPPAIARRIQWFLNAMDQQEAGRAVSVSHRASRVYVGTRLGYDSNARNMTHTDVSLFGLTLNLPNPESDTFHELFAGATLFHQQADRWGWYVDSDVSFRNYHDESLMSSMLVNLRGGPIFLGNNWRLTLPLQLNVQQRRDDNRVTLASLGAEYTRWVDAQQNYTVFGQLGKADQEPGGDLRDVEIASAGFMYTFRPSEKTKFYLGPVLGNEQANDLGPHFGRAWYGLRSGAGYAFNEQQRLDVNLSHVWTRHKADDPVFLSRREDKQLSYGMNFSHRLHPDWLFELGLIRHENASTLNLYRYKRTQLTASIRKEW